MSIALYLRKEDWEYYNDLRRDFGLEDRVSIVLKVKSNGAPYPINELRNMAIQHAKTSHFFMSDMDMWPSFGLYDVLKSLPEFVLQDDYFAGIIPAFEVKKPECKSIEDCVQKWCQCSYITRRVMPMLPRTKPELIQCIKNNTCFLYRENKSTHVDACRRDEQ